MAYLNPVSLSLNIPFTLSGLPEGASGIRATLKRMAALVRESKRRPVVREFARDLVQFLPSKNRLGEILEVFRFVQNDIRYVRDIRGVETLHTPEKLLRSRAGDCDDKAVLISAMLESLGFETRFKAVGFKPGFYSHVYAQVNYGDKWITLETTEPWKIGTEVPGIKSTMIQYIE